MRINPAKLATTGVAFVLSASVLSTPADAGASGVESGWWWAQQDRSGSTPVVGVAADEMALARQLTRVDRSAAVRFELSDPGATSVTMHVSEVSSTLATGNRRALKACLAVGDWEPAAGGAWADRPSADCSTWNASGVRSSDGVWSFDLSGALSQWSDPLVENHGVVLLPKSITEAPSYEVVLRRPTANSFVMEGSDPGPGSPGGDDPSLEDVLVGVPEPDPDPQLPGVEDPGLEAPGVEAPAAPDAPDAPGVPATPEAPGVPGIPDASTPDLSVPGDVPSAPSAPDLPDGGPSDAPSPDLDAPSFGDGDDPDRSTSGRSTSWSGFAGRHGWGGHSSFADASSRADVLSSGAETSRGDGAHPGGAPNEPAHGATALAVGSSSARGGDSDDGTSMAAWIAIATAAVAAAGGASMWSRRRLLEPQLPVGRP